MKIAINGLGRIGRMTLRALQNKAGIEVVAVNDLTDADTLAHLLKFDSIHGPFPGQVGREADDLLVNGNRIKLISERDPEKLPWKALGVDAVIEATGRFTNKNAAEAHLRAGARKVLITAPAGNDVKTIVYGVNNELIGNDAIYSTASCTTNCIAPVLYVLDKTYGIESGYMVTVHAFTADQNLQDAPHRDLRRARAAINNIIPTSTGAAKAIGEVLPNLKGKLDGHSYRVPVIDGSIIDLSINLRQEASADEVKAVLKDYAENSLKGIMAYTEEALVSSDILGNTHSAIVDASLTRSIGKLVKVVAWYDNEIGISNRIAELISRI
ncbi:type I glyceraldehyde-3-phosphate dehydrogenase [uncultured Chitinophaga sp.]|jgi:glyceraldehyde-3-phosphate dehydrogenase, type I|uniref:type I glyceraldehyde-3-phosphate dehydrogenase n=1 Tax=uncultured Chitinophaga sp. TaxID=339340 RepID=UPI002637BDD1|nr:type I glyceraldehyde-3-phosphate dehydrogenase [uncultured Chitinophaga sp.]